MKSHGMAMGLSRDVSACGFYPRGAGTHRVLVRVHLGGIQYAT